MSATCHDCGRPYADPGFPDLIIPFWAWRQISPTKDDGGLLCPSCICARLEKAGIKCEAAFLSGPIISVDRSVMELMLGHESMKIRFEKLEDALAKKEPGEQHTGSEV